MKKFFNSLIKDKGIRYAVTFSFIIFILQLTLILINYQALPPLIPLFNSLAWGSDRLASSYFIFIIPTFLIITGFINIILAVNFYSKHALVSRMLFFNFLLATFLSMLAIFQILFLVF